MELFNYFSFTTMHMWQSRVEIEHYSVHISIALLHLKHCSAELPLRAGLMRCVNVASIDKFTQRI